MSVKQVRLAPMMEEAIQTLNPNEGLTASEIVQYVCSKLEVNCDQLTERIENILRAGVNVGNFVKNTNTNRYKVNDFGKSEEMCGHCGSRKLEPPRRRPIAPK